MDNNQLLALLLPMGGVLISQGGYQASKHKQWFRADVLMLHLSGYILIHIWHNCQ